RVLFRSSLDLFVVLQLQLEQAHQLHRDPGGAGDPDHRVVVGGEHLLHAAVGDRGAHGRAAVTGHHHATGVGEGHDGGAVRGVDVAVLGVDVAVLGVDVAVRVTGTAAQAVSGQQLRRAGAREVRE